MKRLAHDTPFIGSPVTLGDFWAWAYSDLLDNTLRGALAEYIVATALGVNEGVRVNWVPYDLAYRGLKIEVKSSAFLQSWTRDGHVASVSFGVRPTMTWVLGSSYTGDKKRRADVYVFCLFRETHPEAANPLDLSQWQFYVVQTSLLDAVCGEQKTLSLSALKKLCPSPVPFSSLKESLDALVASS